MAYATGSELQTGLPGLVVAARRRAQALVYPAEKTDLESTALGSGG